MQGMHATRETDLSQSYFTQRPFKNRSIYKEEILDNVKAFRGKNRWRQPLFENASFNCGHDQYFMRRFDMQSFYIYIYILQLNIHRNHYNFLLNAPARKWLAKSGH